MNETNLTPRQKLILNLVNQTEADSGASRGEIQKRIEKIYNVSKPTLIRDLAVLIERKLISSRGKGKKTRYLSFSKNPILRPFDLDKYFEVDPDSRVGVKKSFDFEVFENLKDLFSATELEEVASVQKSFIKETEKLSPDVLKRELERFVIELSWKSSKIEGNTYTLLETENLIKESRQAPGKSREEAIMILNHKEAFDQILKNRLEFKNVTLSEINQLHNIMVKNLNIRAGIRTNAVGITGSVYRPLYYKSQIENAMARLVKTLDGQESVLEKALIANSMISYIQPFSDGNKRTGRMLTNAILLANDYFPLSYRSVDEDEFKKSSILFYEQGSITHLKRIFLEQLVFAYNTYFK